MEHIRTNTYLIASNIISALGFTTKDNLDALESYCSGIKQVESQELSDTPLQAALIHNRELERLVAKHQLQNYTRVEQLIILSIKDTLSQVSLSTNNSSFGIIISTTKGNICQLRKNAEPNYLGNISSRIASYFGAEERVSLISNACISGVSALIVAHRMLKAGIYENIIVVGVDELSQFIVSGFQSFKSLSEEPCKPYDIAHDGLSLGEACGSILLSSTSTPNSIQLLGGAITNDANHISGPSRTGDGLWYAIKEAMNQAELRSQDIDFVNLHGTATVYNDEMEAKAIHLADLAEKPINSFKPYFGHTLGASGVIETIVCTEQLKRKKLFGTLGYNENGVSPNLKIDSKHISLEKAETCIKTASGFGGCNAAIVLSTTLRNIFQDRKETQFVEREKVSIYKNKITKNNETIFSSSSPNFAQFIREAYKDAGEQNQKFYKMDDQCKLGYMAALHLLDNYTFSPQEIGIILANKSSSLDTDIKHQALLDGGQMASPSVFVYTLPNIVAGEICIRHKIQGENTFFVANEYDEESIKKHAQLAMRDTNMKYCIYGWCEYLDNGYFAELRLIEKIK